MARRIPGFWAHPLTYANNSVCFANYNRLYKGAIVVNTSLGKHSYVKSAKLGNAEIGAFCSIGPDSKIGGLGRHPTEFISTHPIFYSAGKMSGMSFCDVSLFEEAVRTRVGNDVWIGASAIVLDGVSIGNGAIIAAGAVVTKDVPAYAIVGGVPAKVIRYRFSESVIDALQELRWWDHEDCVLRALSHSFSKGSEWSLDDIASIRERLMLLSSSPSL